MRFIGRERLLPILRLIPDRFREEGSVLDPVSRFGIA
jgi:hypothetical protein